MKNDYVEKYSDMLRRLAQRLDDDFDGNVFYVYDELQDICENLVRTAAILDR